MAASPAEAVTSEGPDDAPTRSTLSYMHRPPRILPNYGTKYSAGLKLKTSVPRVLLYDNVTQQTILHYQLSGLASQQVKTSRELDMHRKSFQARRTVRERALLKLTKVTHSEDYERFEREYSMVSSAYPTSPTTTGGGARMLPSIQHGRTSRPTAFVKRKRKLSKRLSVSFDGNDQRGCDENQPRTSSPIGSYGVVDNNENGDGSVDKPTVLPAINNTDNGGLVANEEYLRVANSASQRLSSGRRVAFREVKSSQGVTRLFHALPPGNEKDQPDNSTPVATHNTALTQNTPIIEVVREEPPVESSKPTLERDSTSVTLPDIPPSVSREHSMARSRQRSSSSFVRPENRSQTPLDDERFEVLQRILVPQEPRNEGFAELSPTFVRKSPEWLARAQAQKRLLSAAKRKKNKKKDKNRRESLAFFNGNNADEDTRSPSLSGASDIEEDNEPENGVEPNSALKRLG